MAFFYQRLISHNAPLLVLSRKWFWMYNFLFLFLFFGTTFGGCLAFQQIFLGQSFSLLFHILWFWVSLKAGWAFFLLSNRFIKEHIHLKISGNIFQDISNLIGGKLPTSAKLELTIQSLTIHHFQLSLNFKLLINDTIKAYFFLTP